MYVNDMSNLQTIIGKYFNVKRYAIYLPKCCQRKTVSFRHLRFTNDKYDTCNLIGQTYDTFSKNQSNNLL